MKFLVFLEFVFSSLNSTTEAPNHNSIHICEYHLKLIHRRGGSDRINTFKNEFFDQKYDLEVKDIKICSDLFFEFKNCRECAINISTKKILCKHCNSVQSTSFSDVKCDKCSNLSFLMKKIEVLKLCLKKFIIKEYPRDIVGPFCLILKHQFHAAEFILPILSESYFNSNELFILAQSFSVLPAQLNEYTILNSCVKYHSKFENKDSMDLFKDILETDEIYSNDYIYYLAMRFNLDFYNILESSDLLKLIKAVSLDKFRLSAKENEIFIKDMNMKTKNLGLYMNKDDFDELIEAYFEHKNSLDDLYLFFESENKYLEMMITEENVITILKKVFRIKTIKTICPVKNLKIFEDAEEVENLSQNNLMTHFFEISKEGGLLNSESLEVGEIYSKYKRRIELFFIHFTEFTPNGLVKIACIIFSFLNSEINRPDIFKILLKQFYDLPVFKLMKLTHALDLIDLHFHYKIPYDHVTPTIGSVFINIKNGKEINKLFDHIFDNSERNMMLGIFIFLFDVNHLNETKQDLLIKYLIDNFSVRNVIFFNKVECYFSRSTMLQIKYINRIISQINFINSDFFDWFESEIFAHISKNNLDLLLEFCLTHKKYEIIFNLLEYLDFVQLEKIDVQEPKFIPSIFSSTGNFVIKILKYLGTPFFYKKFPYFISELFCLLEKEDVFDRNVILKSILKNPLFVKCYENSHSEKLSSSINFKNKYMSNLVKALFNISKKAN